MKDKINLFGIQLSVKKLKWDIFIQLMKNYETEFLPIPGRRGYEESVRICINVYQGFQRQNLQIILVEETLLTTTSYLKKNFHWDYKI